MNDYEGDASRIKDIARNTIMTNNPDAALRMLVERGGEVKVKKIEAKDNPLGYGGINTWVKTKEGIVAEIQINSPAMIYAKMSHAKAKAALGHLYEKIAKQTNTQCCHAHVLYEEWRTLPLDSPRREAVEKESRQYFANITSKEHLWA